jgi:hypothetical protein
MVKADIKFASGTFRCIGGVNPDGSVKPWLTGDDVKNHVLYLVNKGYAVELVGIVE